MWERTFTINTEQKKFWRSDQSRSPFFFKSKGFNTIQYFLFWFLKGTIQSINFFKIKKSIQYNTFIFQNQKVNTIQYIFEMKNCDKIKYPHGFFCSIQYNTFLKWKKYDTIQYPCNYMLKKGITSKIRPRVKVMIEF